MTKFAGWAFVVGLFLVPQFATAGERDSRACAKAATAALAEISWLDEPTVLQSTEGTGRELRPIDPWIGPPMPDWCRRRSDSPYCDYGWDGPNLCCFPIWVAPGAFCETVCQ
jgi:hypothetical protein